MGESEWLIVEQSTAWSAPQKVERALGILFGVYRVSPGRRLGPFGLMFVGPIGAISYESWWRSWIGACGYEVTVLGRSVYLAWREATPLSVSIVLLPPMLLLAALAAAVLVVI
jgi:hypothetical protein